MAKELPLVFVRLERANHHMLASTVLLFSTNEEPERLHKHVVVHAFACFRTDDGGSWRRRTRPRRDSPFQEG